MPRICTEGLKARQSLAQGIALCQGRPLSTPQALKGRNRFGRISPFQGWALAGVHFAGRCPALLITGLSALTRWIVIAHSFRIAKHLMIFILSCLAAILPACNKDDGKQMQSINFGEITPQLLRNGSVALQATASSGLPVLFSSWDTEIAVIEGDRAVFRQAGKVNIIASQPGNDRFHEAPEITQQLLIRDWDPNKKTQEITFELPADWRLSRDGQQLKLYAVASSGLPVSYVLGSKAYGRFLTASTVYFYHAGEGGTPRVAYDVQISITASQIGNDEYNPADNVERTIRVIGDVFHD
jgi:hypothetical protein